MLHKSSMASNVYNKVLNLGVKMLFVAKYANRVRGDLSN